MPNHVKAQLFLLLKDVEISGPVRGNWPNYGKLGKNRHHCHIKKGRPTYVAVWEKQDDDISALLLNSYHKKQENQAAIFKRFSVDADKSACKAFVNRIPLIVS